MYVILIFLAVCLLAAIDLCTKHKIDRKWQIAVLVVVFVFFGLRLNMGNDTYTYAMIYNWIPENYYYTILYQEGRFPLFALLIRFFKVWDCDFVFFQMIANWTVLLLIGYTTIKNSDHILTSLVIYIGAGFLNVYYTSAMRQGIVMAVFFYAFFRFLLKKQYWKYYGLMIPCFFIHDLTIVTWILPVVYSLIDRLWNKKGMIITGIAFAVVFAGFNLFSTVALNLLPGRWASLLSALMDQPVSITGIGLTVVQTLLILGLYYFSDESVKQDKNTRFEVYICIFAFMFYAVFFRIQLMSRVVDYLNIIYLVLIPKMLVSVPDLKKKALSIFAVCGLNFVLCYFDLRDGMQPYYDQSILHYPYVSQFNVEKSYEYYDWHDHMIRNDITLEGQWPE